MRVIDERQHLKQRWGFFAFAAIFPGNIGFGQKTSPDIAGWLRLKTPTGTSQSAIKLGQLDRSDINPSSSSRLCTGTGFWNITDISALQASGQGWQSIPGSETMAFTPKTGLHQVLNIPSTNESVPIDVEPDVPNCVVELRLPQAL
jgi:hypothetical protein